MNNSILLLLLVAFCCPLRAQQPFSPGIRHQLTFNAGTMVQGNGKVYVAAAYEYELNRRFSLDLKCGVDAGSAKKSILDERESVTTVRPFVNQNPDGALVKFRLTPEQRTMISVSPRLQFNLRQNPANRIWFAAGPSAVYVRDITIKGVSTRLNPVTGETAEAYVNDLRLQRYLTWGMNGELGYHLKINKAMFAAAHAGTLIPVNFDDTANSLLFYATLGIGFSLGGYPNDNQ